MNKFYIFLIRVILGCLFATIISNLFIQNNKMINILGLVIIIVGLAYFAEFLRNRKKK